MFVECVCNNCPGHIEFEESNAGQTVACPHCGIDTVLYVPQGKPADNPPQPSPNNSYTPQPISPVSNNNLFACKDCGKTVSVNAEFCPHCGASYKKAPEAPVQWGRIKKKGESAGAGCLVELVGLVLLPFFPIGTVIGLAVMLCGHSMSYHWVCSICGNRLSGKRVKLCPACKAHF